MAAGDREPSPETELLTQSTGWLLYNTGRGVARELEAELKSNDIGWRGYSVMGALEAAGALSQQAIGRHLDIDRSTMVHVIDDLERRGLVARDRDRADRRAYSIRLTDRGRRLVTDVLHPATDVVCGRLTGRLSGEDRAHLNRILTQLLPATVNAPIVRSDAG